MKWFHKTSEAWMKARRLCLTATEVKNLLPVTKTGRIRKVTDEDMLAIYARKVALFDPDDCISTGPAARGHILEPYAIDFFNRNYDQFITLHHWDDAIVAKDIGTNRGLGFSPDAMSIEQPNLDRCIYDSMELKTIDYIGEVKSYSPDRHLICGLSDPSELEERWQLAVAMACVDTIKYAYLIFYNPSMRMQMFVHEYSRDDLIEEIDIVNKVEKDWLEFLDRLDLDTGSARVIVGTMNAEQAIINQILDKELLDPVKSVMMNGEENTGN